jgi:hypothetical protein
MIFLLKKLDTCASKKSTQQYASARSLRKRASYEEMLSTEMFLLVEQR